MTSSHCSSVMRNNKLSLEIPALLTQISTVPNLATTSFTNISQAAKSPALAWYAFAFTPNFSISATKLFAFSALLSLT